MNYWVYLCCKTLKSTYHLWRRESECDWKFPNLTAHNQTTTDELSMQLEKLLKVSARLSLWTAWRKVPARVLVQVTSEDNPLSVSERLVDTVVLSQPIRGEPSSAYIWRYVTIHFPFQSKSPFIPNLKSSSEVNYSLFCFEKSLKRIRPVASRIPDPHTAVSAPENPGSFKWLLQSRSKIFDPVEIRDKWLQWYKRFFFLYLNFI